MNKGGKGWRHKNPKRKRNCVCVCVCVSTGQNMALHEIPQQRTSAATTAITEKSHLSPSWSLVADQEITQAINCNYQTSVKNRVVSNHHRISLHSPPLSNILHFPINFNVMLPLKTIYIYIY